MRYEKTPHADLQEDLAEVRRIITQKLKGYRVRLYLFGSRAQGKACETSDIDVAILSLEPLPPGLIAEIREALEESHIPFEVDVVDLTEADAHFRERVLKEGILWNDCGSV